MTIMKKDDLVIVLRRVSGFLTVSEALNLLLLDYYCYQHLPNPEYYQNVAIAILNTLLESPQINCLAKASEYFRIKFNSFEEFF